MQQNAIRRFAADQKGTAVTQTDNYLTATTSADKTLHRVLKPRSVAFVGVSETSPFAHSVHRTMQGEAEVLFVHPKHDTLFGQPCVPSVADLGRPVDAVFSAVAAAHSVGIVEQAATIGAGGVVLVAGGFAEAGETGAKLQQQITTIANGAGMHLVGPNGIGMINVPDQVDLTVLEAFGRRPGGLSAVTHSGAMIEAIAASACRPGGAGLNLLISAGNEAVTDLADYLDFLVDDEQTTVIALALEKIRRPDAFFAAAARAQEAGKPIVAIKMGRSERGQRMAASHTGSLVGDAWVYEVGLRQAGIELAHEIDELVDRVQFLEQLNPQRWTEVRGLAVLTATGGFAQLASDLAEDTGVDIPALEQLQPFIDENIPGKPLANPLDATGFVGSVPGLWESIVDRYAADPDVDALLYTSQHADWDTNGRQRAEEFAERAQRQPGKPFLLAPLAGIGGQWLGDLRRDGVGVGNGLLGCLRGLQTMGNFVRSRNQGPRAVSATDVPVLQIRDEEVLEVAEGRMLSFGATMRLLTDAGIPVARWAVFDGAVEPVPFAGPYVVKLADVAHRTEHNAVRVNVAEKDLQAVTAELREIARRDDLPTTVAVQEMVSGHGEIFIGLQGASELGPLTVFGLGGVFVEIMKKVGGRLAPFDRRVALELVGEVDDTGIMDGFRGAPAWDRDRLAEILCAAGDLAARGRESIESLDINPLIITADGPVAVDGLCLLQRPQ
ncbi:CoA-binding protein [Rhodococcus sp. ACPA4]|nr:CoA-binding protein [Rhodococcus sp. ACPA4]RZL22141.1 MAG: CoA-binding protein [Rhodococcus sp. (in: high G+C Gram-positive bacteria)]